MWQAHYRPAITTPETYATALTASILEIPTRLELSTTIVTGGPISSISCNYTHAATSRCETPYTNMPLPKITTTQRNT